MSTNKYFLDEQKTITVSGKILDEQGVPLLGVTVIQAGTSNGTTTDFDGNYSFKIPSGADVEFSYVGYKTQTIENVTDADLPLDVTLQLDSTNLEEVVVVGYGEQTKQTVVGSVGTVKGEELLQVGSVNSVSEALQGQLPGLTAISSGGAPGADAANLFIRGRSTFNNSSPLVLVDNVERDLNNIDPNEIESISVLKDAAATAVYGVRGANGVILLTTKRGKLGPPKFRLTSNFGFKLPTVNADRADYLTAQRAYNEATINDRNYGALIPQSTLNAWEANYDKRGPFNPFFPEVNWRDEIVGTGYEQTYNLNVNGGSKLIKYFVSLGYRDDGDIYNTTEQPEYDPAFGQERYNWRSNFDFDITPTTRFSVNFSGNYRVRSQPAFRQPGGSGVREFFDRIYNSPQNVFPLRYPDGSIGDDSSGDGNLNLFVNKSGVRIFQNYQGIYDAQLEQELDFITKGLSFRGTISYTSSSNYGREISRDGGGSGNPNLLDVVRFFRQYDYSNPMTDADGNVTYPIIQEIRWPSPQAQEGPITSNLPGLNGYGRRLNYRFQAKYKRKFGAHAVGGDAIMLRQSDVGRGGYPSKREEWIGRVTYNFNKRYLLEASGNYSGSENFAPGLRFGFFPAGGVGWVVTEEPVIKGLGQEWLNFFKINYTYGVVGNDRRAGNESRFQYLQSYDAGGNIRFGLENPTFYSPLYTEGTIANPNSTWETSIQQNLKFSLDIFNRLNMELDLYKQDREDILAQRGTLPSFAGFPSLPNANLGITKSRGYEFTLGWKDKIGGDFNYYANLGLSYNQNRIVFRDEPVNAPDYQKQTGKPIGVQTRLINGGFYTSLDDIFNGPNQNNGRSRDALVPGDLMFVDYNGSGTADSNDQVPMEQLNYPARTYNFNFGFTWRGFGFNALIYGVSDVSYTLPGDLYFNFNEGNIQAQADVLDRWTPETAATATKPALHINDVHNSTGSTLLFLDGSYVRLKNIEVNYRFENKLLNNFGIKSLQLYANGNNVLTFSDLDDRIDPETPNNNDYPVIKRYNLGLRMTF